MKNNFCYNFALVAPYNKNYFHLEFFEQLLRQNQNRRLTRDDTTLDFLLYIFDAIELLRLTVV